MKKKESMYKTFYSIFLIAFVLVYGSHLIENKLVSLCILVVLALADIYLFYKFEDVGKVTKIITGYLYIVALGIYFMGEFLM